MAKITQFLVAGLLALTGAASAQPCNAQQNNQVPYGHYYCNQHSQYCNHSQNYVQPGYGVMYSAPVTGWANQSWANQNYNNSCNNNQVRWNNNNSNRWNNNYGNWNNQNRNNDCDDRKRGYQKKSRRQNLSGWNNSCR
jgi:hypothetical protein